MNKSEIGKVVYPEWIVVAQEQLNKKNYDIFLHILADVVVYGEIPSTYDQDTKAYKLFKALKILGNIKSKLKKYENKMNQKRNENDTQSAENEQCDLGKYRNKEIIEIKENTYNYSSIEQKENTYNISDFSAGDDLPEFDEPSTSVDTPYFNKYGVDKLSHMLQTDTDYLEILLYYQSNPTDNNYQKIKAYWSDDQGKLAELENFKRNCLIK